MSRLVTLLVVVSVITSQVVLATLDLRSTHRNDLSPSPIDTVNQDIEEYLSKWETLRQELTRTGADSAIREERYSSTTLRRVYHILEQINQDRDDLSALYLNEVLSTKESGRGITLDLVLHSMTSESAMYHATIDEDGTLSSLIVDSDNSAGAVMSPLLQGSQHSLLVNTPTANFNGSDGMDQLVAMYESTKCKRNWITKLCAPGTVKTDPWVDQALALQRDLAADRPLNFHEVLTTHNSFNNKANGAGYGDLTLSSILQSLSGGKWEFMWAQQFFTVTDQLNMGARQIMYDPVWFAGKMRMCHCGSTWKWFDKALEWIEQKIGHKFEFDSDDLGCTIFDRTLDTGVAEIRAWMDKHPTEFLHLHINDEGHSADWGHLDKIRDPLAKYLSDILFRPSDLRDQYKGQWPSVRQLLKDGKRILVQGDRIYDDNYFRPLNTPGWDYDTMVHFTPYPECGGYGPGKWVEFGGESLLVGPIYDGPKKEGLIVKEGLPSLLECGISRINLDLASPELMRAAVWTWLPGFPQKEECAAMTVGNANQGRWVTTDCSRPIEAACQSTSDVTQWILTEAVAFDDVRCPQGYAFAAPQHGYVNRKLLDTALAQGTEEESTNRVQVWVNHRQS
eukprot:GFYU01005009.1.p1 GENE.GFYU01005009.1~~GFYU01005009.1.p1  ORF type:complete len:621 (-),score=121.69 GFYU01005009.1:66-1928(-)